MDNEPSFKTAGMSFDGHGCVRAFKDRHGGYNNQDLQVDLGVESRCLDGSLSRIVRI